MKFVTAAVILWTGALLSAAVPAASPVAAQANRPAADAGSGEGLFQAQCGFCHGRDATGGQTGPDLTDSELVGQDVNGDKISVVVKNGRPEKGMPPFTAMSDTDLRKIVEYVHKRKTDVEANPGRRRKVTAADLSTGDANAGRAYFDGAGGCTACHSPRGDLNGVASRYRGLALMQRMIFPSPGNAAQPAPGEKRAPSTAIATVTPSSGQTVTGSLVYRDEFTIAVIDAAGAYRSWPASAVTATVKDPVDAHAELLAKYTDADIHNLYAYLQTLK